MIGWSIVDSSFQMLDSLSQETPLDADFRQTELGQILRERLAEISRYKIPANHLGLGCLGSHRLELNVSLCK